MRENPEVVIGISGGIAAYKAIEVLRGLQKEGLAVRVIMTPAATRFVNPLTFEALSRQKVQTSVFPEQRSEKSDIFPHIYPASECDLFSIIPASADIIAKLACGIADDIISASALALPPKTPRFICPAMHTNMWNQKVVQDNLTRLKDLGWSRIDPEGGRLACGAKGPGRLAECTHITARLLETLER